MKKIVIFASGSGSNAENIIRFFKEKNDIKVVGVFCNNPKAKVIERAQNLQMPCTIFDRETWKNEDKMMKEIKNSNADFIILAGFLWLVPYYLIQAFPNKIINIHPALLPSYGGKGMYGEKVHETVVKNKETESGITIHLVNEHYDEGEILAQFRVHLSENETPTSLAEKIHELEMKNFPSVIQDYIIKDKN